MRKHRFNVHERIRPKSHGTARIKGIKELRHSHATYAQAQNPIRQSSLNVVICIAGHVSTKIALKVPSLVANAPVMSLFNHKSLQFTLRRFMDRI